MGIEYLKSIELVQGKLAGFCDDGYVDTNSITRHSLIKWKSGAQNRSCVLELITVQIQCHGRCYISASCCTEVSFLYFKYFRQ
jgi:hypothetical protein